MISGEVLLVGDPPTKNKNGEFDPLEDWKYVIPLYDDAVFQGATDCVYYYDNSSNKCIGTAPGWNQSVGLDHYSPVECASREGARFSNEAAWCAGVTAFTSQSGIEA